MTVTEKIVAAVKDTAESLLIQIPGYELRKVAKEQSQRRKAQAERSRAEREAAAAWVVGFTTAINVVEHTAAQLPRVQKELNREYLGALQPDKRETATTYLSTCWGVCTHPELTDIRDNWYATGCKLRDGASWESLKDDKETMAYSFGAAKKQLQECQMRAWPLEKIKGYLVKILARVLAIWPNLPLALLVEAYESLTSLEPVEAPEPEVDDVEVIA